MTDTTQTNEQAEFAIQKVYTKDISFEAPNTPEIFMNDLKPEVNLDLQTSAKELSDDAIEVVLTVTVTTKSEEKVAFLCEVQQAGIFLLKNFPEEQMGPLQGSVCPNILFPFAREVISDLVTRAGFPQLLLSPINFDALYAQQQEQQASDNKQTVE